MKLMDFEGVQLVELPSPESRYTDLMGAMFGGLLSPIGLAAESPILAMRRCLENAAYDNERLGERDLLAAFVATWNALRDGRPLQKLQRPRGGSWTAATFPVPK